MGEYWRYKSWLQEGQRWLGRALDLGDQAPESVHAQLLTGAGFMAFLVNDPAEGKRLYEKALVIARKLNNQSQIAQILISLGLRSSNLSEISLETSEELLALSRQIGDKSEIAHGLNVLGEIHRLQGDYAAAKQVNEEALPITREIGHRLREAMIISDLGWVAFNLDDFEQARSRFLEFHKLAVETGDDYMIAAGLACGGVLGALGEPERATRLLAAGDTQLAAIGSRWQPTDQIEVDKLIALVRDQLDDETFDRLWTEGASMSLEDALELALREDSPTPPRAP